MNTCPQFNQAHRSARPAARALLVRTWQAARQTWHALRRAAQTRATLAQWRRMDDWLLADIGVARSVLQGSPDRAELARMLGSCTAGAPLRQVVQRRPAANDPAWQRGAQR